MRKLVAVLGLVVVVGCGSQPTGKLADARKGFQTRAQPNQPGDPVDVPPPEVFDLVKYDAPVGPCSGYLTPDPKDGKKRPAIVWITGGDCNSINDVWSPARVKNDQTAAQYRQAGIVMFFPSLRGGNDNPGQREGFFGEVDDVLAAADFLAKQPHVDPKRIYLGGHSTGGTLVLLVAAATDRFRAVFSFGPTDDVSRYPPEFTPFDTRDAREVELRSPIKWLHSIACPTFVFEGEREANTAALNALRGRSKNDRVRFYSVPDADHFSLLAPINFVIAGKILKDAGETTNLAFTPMELTLR